MTKITWPYPGSRQETWPNSTNTRSVRVFSSAVFVLFCPPRSHTFEYVMTRCFFVLPEHMAVGRVPYTHLPAIFVSGTPRHRPKLLLFSHHTHFDFGTQPPHPNVGVDISPFSAALSQPVDIKGMIESLHRLPRCKSLEMSWSFQPFGLFKSVLCHDVVGTVLCFACF